MTILDYVVLRMLCSVVEVPTSTVTVHGKGRVYRHKSGLEDLETIQDKRTSDTSYNCSYPPPVPSRHGE